MAGTPTLAMDRAQVNVQGRLPRAWPVAGLWEKMVAPAAKRVN